MIPAYNEEVTVAGVVSGHRTVARTLASSFEIIVCDDGSTDGTWDTLERSCGEVPELRIVRNRSRRGIPTTMNRLYGEALGEWIYFAPADGQVPAAALELMWSIRDGAALVVGRRVPRRDPASRILIARVYSAILRLIFRLPVQDIDSVKLYRADELHAVPPRSESNFFEAEILIALCSRKRTVREIDIPHRPRIAGKANGVTPGAALLALRDISLFTLGWLLLRPFGRSIWRDGEKADQQKEAATLPGPEAATPRNGGLTWRPRKGHRF